jgi:hypothetical protein
MTLATAPGSRPITRGSTLLVHLNDVIEAPVQPSKDGYTDAPTLLDDIARPTSREAGRWSSSAMPDPSSPASAAR